MRFIYRLKSVDGKSEFRAAWQLIGQRPGFFQSVYWFIDSYVYLGVPVNYNFTRPFRVSNGEATSCRFTSVTYAEEIIDSLGLGKI